LGEDFDIFAGAGEYEGIDFGNDDGEGEGEGEAEMELPSERGDASLGSVVVCHTRRRNRSNSYPLRSYHSTPSISGLLLSHSSHISRAQTTG